MAARSVAIQSARNRLPAFALMAGAAFLFIVVPIAVPTYVQNLLSEILILGIFAMSLDLLMGYTGLLSLGHAAYFGVAAYVAGIVVARYGIDSFWIVGPLAVWPRR
jgi:branched-chain amino acid transport system permease protein